MAILRTLDEIIEQGSSLYTNHTVNGKCAKCGECCCDFIPTSDEEIRRLKAYAREHGLKEHTQAPILEHNIVDLTCPFLNWQTKKCEVYEVRPQICRDFICSKPVDVAQRDKKLVHIRNAPHSLRWEIFGNPSTIKLLFSAII